MPTEVSELLETSAPQAVERGEEAKRKRVTKTTSVSLLKIIRLLGRADVVRVDLATKVPGTLQKARAEMGEQE